MSHIQEHSLSEMREEIERRECAYEGHPPSTVIRVDEQAIAAYCRCGKVQWVKAE